MSEKIQEAIDYLTNGESFSKSDIVNDTVIDTLKKIDPRLSIFPDEISLLWGDGYISDLQTYSNHYYDVLIGNVVNVLKSLQQDQ